MSPKRFNKVLPSHVPGTDTHEALEVAAQLFRQVDYHAPKPAKRQQRMTTQTLDRSEGGGIKM